MEGLSLSDAQRVEFSIVEAVLSRREIDRRVLTANFNERVGLTTCKKALLDHAGHRTCLLAELRWGSDSLKESAKMRYTSDLCGSRKSVDRNDENGLGDENCDSSNVPRNMR